MNDFWFLIGLFYLPIIIIMICILTNKRKKYVLLLKRIKTWMILLVITLSPFILYSIVTIVLILIRGECFVAYHEYVGDYHYIVYQDSKYVEIIDEEDKSRMNNSVDFADWSENKMYVLYESISFPYVQYWYPDILLEGFRVTNDGKYMYTYTLGGGTDYQRMEE